MYVIMIHVEKKEKKINNQSRNQSRGHAPLQTNIFSISWSYFFFGKIVCWRPPALEGPTGNPTSAAGVLYL